MVHLQDIHRKLEAYQILFEHTEIVFGRMLVNRHTSLYYEFVRLMSIIDKKNIIRGCDFCGDIGMCFAKVPSWGTMITLCQPCSQRKAEYERDAILVKSVQDLLNGFEPHSYPDDRISTALLTYCWHRGLDLNNYPENLREFLEIDKYERLYIPSG